MRRTGDNLNCHRFSSGGGKVKREKVSTKQHSSRKIVHIGPPMSRDMLHSRYPLRADLSLKPLRNLQCEISQNPIRTGALKGEQ